ncbi:ATPase AAA [Advenella kashmirensis W13003]|uniref:ATPase AAA n=1 Tax=Advenella kashmirensis W13003 TaxID=1424334 RepID=V8QN41_9BURK|nr:MoxR family ATPase [Advenella kashmirensis]ETF00409.1 ATPase AAA [Advenella kashmirensis W13003]
MIQGTAEDAIDLVQWRQHALLFEQEVAKAAIGQTRAIRLITIAIFARGHVLLEGDVGVGKTLMLRAVARAIGGAYSRVEGTIDLMPSDLIYHTYLNEEGKPRVEAGPLLSHGEDISVFFFNEINRARPQVHSLLLRLMAEKAVNAFNRDIQLPNVQVFADRNQIEKEETFELPAAARDRFFMEIPVQAPRDRQLRRELIFNTRYHDVDLLIEQVDHRVLDYTRLNDVARHIQNHVQTSRTLQDYVVTLWDAVREPQQAGIDIAGVDTARLIKGGASPRGMAVLVRAAKILAWLEGRDMVLPEDVREVFYETVGHRIFLNPIYEMRREDIVSQMCRQVFSKVAVP